MGERTEYAPGTFCWVDLGTNDIEASKAFYGTLFGWTFEDMPAGENGEIYSMASLDGGKTVAALFPPQPGAPEAWSSYVSVEDADATAARVTEAGGTVLAGPFDVFTSGRMAVVQDPTGAVVSLWQPRDHIGAGLVNAPGALTWNELWTNDTETAKAFYTQAFGWITEEAEGGTGYTMWNTSAGGQNGGMWELRPEMTGVPPHWVVYFGTADLDASVAQATELGAQVHVPPTAIAPGRFATLSDPRGAVFNLFEGHFDE